MTYESPLTTSRNETVTDDDLATFFKAMGHPARIKILRHLLEENRCICGRIVSRLPLAQSTVSQHLKILKEAGLVQGEVEGPKTCYCIDREKLTTLCAQMISFCQTEEKE